MPRFIDSMKIFSSAFFMNSYTDVIIFTSKPSWTGALFLLRDLNISSNSSSLNTVSFKVEFTVGRYDLKFRSHCGILLARFGPMLIKNSLNFSAINFASRISILSSIRCLGNVSLLHFFLPIIFFHYFPCISYIIFK